MIGVRGTLGVALAAMAALLFAWLLLAAPAFADANAEGGTIQYVDCDQVQAAAAEQYNAGNTGDAGAIAQDLHINQDQVLACLDSSVGDGSLQEDTVEETTTEETTTEETVRAGKKGSASADVIDDTIVKGTLPDTGGFSLPALAAYALVISGVFAVGSLIGRRR